MAGPYLRDARESLEFCIGIPVRTEILALCVYAEHQHKRYKPSRPPPRRAYDPSMPLTSGATFAGYTILRLLGSGGMGEVYLAQHPRLPRRDALKILPQTMTADSEFRQRFHREADLAATLWHPHIVQVHDRGEFDDQLWIAMDYVEGADAGQLMKAQYPGGMPARDVCAIVTAVAGALDYAHQRGLLHRDVKPANILLTNPEDDERRILLADFGIARQVADVSGLTATNMTVGTVAYCAPEQLMGADIDGRADQYALAATAFHLLTGGPPYQHSNPVAVISQHLNAAPPKLSSRRPELAHLDQVLSTALAKDPAERFGRCREFATKLSERVAAVAESDRGTEAGITVASATTGSETQVAVRRPPGGAVQSARHSATPGSTATKSPPPPKEGPPSGTEPAAAKTKRRKRTRILLGSALAVVVVAAIVATVYVVMPKNGGTSTPPAAGPVLDGTYRRDYDDAKQTVNGAPAPARNTNDTTWWAFRSSCTPTGCVATGTRIDDNNHQVAQTPASTMVLHFVDGHWQDEPARQQMPHPRCLGGDGKSIVAGADTVMSTYSLEPQPDGTLRGVETVTFLTNECGNQGEVLQLPFVAARIGDVPPGVTVADPATAIAPPTTSRPALTIAGPVLDGTYRQDYDNAKQTANGVPTTGGPNDTHWWAFRSLCTSAGCAAAGSELADNNHEEATGVADVLHFTDGQWQDTPSLVSQQCTATNGTAATEAETFYWSWEPQPDGTLRGVQINTALTNECGNQGTVWRTPLVATRVGDVPPSVMVPDPALFEGPTAPGN